MRRVSLTVGLAIAAIVVLYALCRYVRTQSLLREMARDVFTSFNDLGVTYWADFGTLLGIIRDNDIIAYDDDVDVCVIDNLETHTLMETSVRARLESLGYTLKRLHWQAYRVFTQYGLFTDVFLQQINGETIIGATGENSNISKRLVGSPKIHWWKGIAVRVPEHVHEALVWRYGDTYMTPIKNFKGRGS